MFGGRQTMARIPASLQTARVPLTVSADYQPPLLKSRSPATKTFDFGADWVYLTLASGLPTKSLHLLRS